MQRQHEVALAGTFVVARNLRRDRVRNRGRRGVSRKNQTFLQRKSSPGQSIAPVLGTSPFAREGSCERSHDRSAPRPSLSQRPSTHVNGHHSSATESRLTAVNTTEAPSTAAAPSKGIRDAETARSQRQFSTRLILRFGLMSSILGGGLGLGFLLAGGAVPQAVAGSAVPMLAVLLASTVSSIAGFAFSALCGALLFHLMEDPVYTVQVMIVCSIAIQSLSVAALWRSIDWRSLPVFLIGGVLGVPAGVYLLLQLPSGTYRHVIGGLLIVYAGYLLLRRPTRTLRTGPLSDACAGFLGGLTGGLAGFPGAFVTIWCGLKGWDKARQRGVYQPFILAMQPITLLVIYLMRPSSSALTQLDWKTITFIPAALLGAWFGWCIFKRLSDRQFEVAVYVLLILSGIGLIF